MTRRWTTFFAMAGLVVATAVVGTAQQETIEELLVKAERGDLLAQYELALKYQHGIGVPQDAAESAKWYRLAADQGDPDAQNTLGNMYVNGLGVPQDYAEAARLYRLAADQGWGPAQYNLAKMFIYELGVSQNRTEAARWTRMAADQGIAEAQNSIGSMYRYGLGVPQDDVLAYKYINLYTSRVTGTEREAAIKSRDEIASRLTPDQLAEAQRLAREWDEAHPR